MLPIQAIPYSKQTITLFLYLILGLVFLYLMPMPPKITLWTSLMLLPIFQLHKHLVRQSFYCTYNAHANPNAEPLDPGLLLPNVTNTPQHYSSPQSSQSTSTHATSTTPSLDANDVKSGKKRSLSPDSEVQADKRRRNNAAAAKYRQKKVDRIAELEKALDDVSRERDGLNLQLAQKNGEVELLRRLLSEKG